MNLFNKSASGLFLAVGLVALAGCSGNTALVAATLMYEMLCLFAASRFRSA